MRPRDWLTVLPAALLVMCCKSPKEEPAPEAVASSSSSIPSYWAELGVPAQGLTHVLPESNEHGFYADYDRDRQELLEEVSSILLEAGFSQSCSAFDGSVLGFSKGDVQLALKIDQLPEASLSLFDADGKEPLLHGVCFGRYRRGPSRTLTEEEKIEFGEAVERGWNGEGEREPRGDRAKNP